MKIRIEASELPGKSCAPSGGSPGGYHNVHVGVQARDRRAGLLGLVTADAASATWKLECVAVSYQGGLDLKGPHIQGRPGARFIYLQWVAVNGNENIAMFRRAKLWLDVIPPTVIEEARDRGQLVARLGLTDPKGNPICASVRPPAIEWSAQAE